MTPAFDHGTNWGAVVIADAIAKAERADAATKAVRALPRLPEATPDRKADLAAAARNRARDLKRGNRKARIRRTIRGVQTTALLAATIVSVFTMGAMIGAEVVRAACVGCGL